MTLGFNAIKRYFMLRYSCNGGQASAGLVDSGDGGLRSREHPQGKDEEMRAKRVYWTHQLVLGYGLGCLNTKMMAEERRKKLKGKWGKQEPYINRTLHATQTVAARAADKGARRDNLMLSYFL